MTRSAGFSLVEVALSIGIVAFALLALMGLLPVGINAVRDASEESAAMNLTSAVLADLRVGADPADGRSIRYRVPIPASGDPDNQDDANDGVFKWEFFLAEDGRGEVGTGGLAAAQARYRVRLDLTPPAANQLGTTAVAHIRVFWPAQAAVEEASGRVETVTVYTETPSP